MEEIDPSRSIIRIDEFSSHDRKARRRFSQFYLTGDEQFSRIRRGDYGSRWRLVKGGGSLGLEDYRRSVSETKRAAILKAARENFLKGGYSQAAMAEIARDADVSTATL